MTFWVFFQWYRANQSPFPAPLMLIYWVSNNKNHCCSYYNCLLEVLFSHLISPKYQNRGGGRGKVDTPTKMLFDDLKGVLGISVSLSFSFAVGIISPILNFCFTSSKPWKKDVSLYRWETEAWDNNSCTSHKTWSISRQDETETPII